MKSYNKICTVIIIILASIFVICNILQFGLDEKNQGRTYRVEANRILNQIKQEGFKQLDLSQYKTVTAVYPMTENSDDFFQTESDYLIREMDGTLYRIEYNSNEDVLNTKLKLFINGALGVMAALVLFSLLYVRQKIIKPFEQMKEVPYELSKGNLTVPIKENKSKFFGKFVWGVDMLRETMEEQKQHELDLQKEKKTLILSISHDIKTPLSAIKLYASAISKGLYEGKERQTEIAKNINAKADEIEQFVSEIIKASNEDFLNLQVRTGEFYLSEAIENIKVYYSEKLALARTDFVINDYDNCMLKGDCDRFIEVLQNVMENAIKYGDGHNIEISFSEEEDCRLVQIKNTGCTLAATEVPHIFDSFWRGSNVGSNSGSGLGLYICRQLMHKMDGEIFAEVDGNEMCVTVVGRKN